MKNLASPDWPGFHARGWNAFSLPSGTKKPNAPWTRWQTERSTPADHARWLAAGSNAAIVTGSVSGLVVLDCDTPEAIDEAERRGTNGAPFVETAKGRHYYFRHPGDLVRCRVAFMSGMDLRGDGGFVVAPGSTHPNGAQYRWQKPPQGELPPMPGWLRAALEKPVPTPATASAASPTGATSVGRLPTSVTATAYGQAALQQEIQVMRYAPEGGRNDQLNKSAFALAQLSAGGEVDGPEAKALLHEAALESGLHASEIEVTLASGWESGTEQPRSATRKTSASASIPRIIRADELDAMQFAPLRWAIPGILPEGMTCMAGKPKAGKSYLAMQMALAVASGDGTDFGLPDMEKGEVLYLALEDGPRRLQERMRQMLMGRKPAGLHLTTTWPRIDQGGIEELAKWCDANPKIALIIIDTLRTIKAPTTGRRSAYDEDAGSVAPLHEFTKSRPGLAVVVIHHTRKQESADEFDLISGTHGLSGVFDTLAVLSADATGSATLSAQGRDLEHYKKALERDKRTGGWIFKGEAMPRAKTGERQELLDLLTKADAAMTLGDLARGIGKQPDTTRRLLKGLLAEGLICQPSYGTYALFTPSIRSITEFDENTF